MIHDEIVTHEVAKLAKEKGFNEKCYHYYQNGVLESDGCFNRYNKGVDSVCSAPTQSLLQRWLRDEKGLILIIRFDPSEQMYDWGVFLETQPIAFTSSEEYFEKYELALEDALKYALENLV